MQLRNATRTRTTRKSPPGHFHLYYFCTFAKIYRLITASGRPSNMAIRYYNDDCTFRLPQKRLTAAWLREVAEAEGYALGDVSYIFCSAQRLLEMNRQWLGARLFHRRHYVRLQRPQRRTHRFGRHFHRRRDRSRQCPAIRLHDTPGNAQSHRTRRAAPLRAG